jgi:hypothetical protein
MVHDNALPPMPDDDPQRENPLRPWVIPVLTALIVLAIVAWNVDMTNRIPVVSSPNTATGSVSLLR